MKLYYARFGLQFRLGQGDERALNCVIRRSAGRFYEDRRQVASLSVSRQNLTELFMYMGQDPTGKTYKSVKMTGGDRDAGSGCAVIGCRAPRPLDFAGNGLMLQTQFPGIQEKYFAQSPILTSCDTLVVYCTWLDLKLKFGINRLAAKVSKIVFFALKGD